MKRALQCKYVTTSTAGEKVQAFVPTPLPPRPLIKKVQTMPGIVILGDFSIRGNIKAVQSLSGAPSNGHGKQSTASPDPA
jgi:hypothetical protein